VSFASRTSDLLVTAMCSINSRTTTALAFWRAADGMDVAERPSAVRNQ